MSSRCRCPTSPLGYGCPNLFAVVPDPVPEVHRGRVVAGTAIDYVPKGSTLGEDVLADKPVIAEASVEAISLTEAAVYLVPTRVSVELVGSASSPHHVCAAFGAYGVSVGCANQGLVFAGTHYGGSQRHPGGQPQGHGHRR